MADVRPTNKRTLQNIFAEVVDKKLILVSGTQRQQDSRFMVQDVGLDHVVIKLLGEELFVLPFAAISHVKVERLVVTVTYR